MKGSDRSDKVIQFSNSLILWWLVPHALVQHKQRALIFTRNNWKTWDLFFHSYETLQLKDPTFIC